MFSVTWLLLCLTPEGGVHRKSVLLDFSLSCIGEGNSTPLQYSCLENPMDGGAWWAAVHGVAKSQTWLSNFTFTFHFHALEKEMATHSRVLAWRIPGMEEPGGLPSMGSHRVRHNWSDLAAAAAMLLEESVWMNPGTRLNCVDTILSTAASLRAGDHVSMRNHSACMPNRFRRVRLCDAMDYSPLGSSVHGILQARILEWVAMPSSKGSSPPRDQICVSCISCIAGRFFTAEPLGISVCN